MVYGMLPEYRIDVGGEAKNDTGVSFTSSRDSDSRLKDLAGPLRCRQKNVPTVQFAEIARVT